MCPAFRRLLVGNPNSNTNMMIDGTYFKSHEICIREIQNKLCTLEILLDLPIQNALQL